MFKTLAQNSKTNEESYKAIVSELKKSILNPTVSNQKIKKSYQVALKVLKILYTNGSLQPQVQFIAATFLKLNCSQSATKHACDDDELSEINKKTIIMGISTLGILLSLEILWIAIKTYQKYLRKKENNLINFHKIKKLTHEIKEAFFELINQLFMSHQLTVAAIVYLLNIKTMSTMSYVFKLLTPSLLIALLASPKVKNLITCNKLNRNNLVKMFSDIPETFISSAGKFFFILAELANYGKGIITTKKFNKVSFLSSKNNYLSSFSAAITIVGVSSANKYSISKFHGSIEKLRLIYNISIEFLIFLSMNLLIWDALEKQIEDNWHVWPFLYGILVLGLTSGHFLNKLYKVNSDHVRESPHFFHAPDLIVNEENDSEESESEKSKSEEEPLLLNQKEKKICHI